MFIWLMCQSTLCRLGKSVAEKEGNMAAFFGIEERNAQDFLDQSMLCLPSTPDGELDLQGIVSPIKNEDVVFIKHCTPEFSMHIKAVGVVRSDFPTASNSGVCLPVEWVWRGEKVLESLDEELPICANALYEEHNIQAQREIIDLLPQKYQMAQEW
jgi:hypothetical protein